MVWHAQHAQKKLHQALKECPWTAEWRWEGEGELWKDHWPFRWKPPPWDARSVLGPVSFCKRQSCPRKVLLLSSGLQILHPSLHCHAPLGLCWELGQAIPRGQK